MEASGLAEINKLQGTQDRHNNRRLLSLMELGLRLLLVSFVSLARKAAGRSSAHRQARQAIRRSLL